MDSRELTEWNAFFIVDALNRAEREGDADRMAELKQLIGEEL